MEEALAVNLSAPFHLIRLALPTMKKRGWGRIINIASIYATRAVPERMDYVTTKTGLLGMTRAVAIETSASGITCNALCRARCQHRPFRKRLHRSRPPKAAASMKRRATTWRHASRPDGLSPWKLSGRWPSSCAARLRRTFQARPSRSTEAGPSLAQTNDPQRMALNG